MNPWNLNIFSHYAKLKTGHKLLIMHGILANFSFSFVPLFLRSKGFPFYSLVLLFVLYTGLCTVLIPFFTNFNLRRSIAAGYLCFSIMGIVLIFNFQAASFFLYAVLIALSMIFFWIPVNYLFFEGATSSTNAMHSSMYLLTFSGLNVLVPLLGAFLIKITDFPWLFGLAALLYLLPVLYVANKVPNENLSAPFMECLTNFKSLRTLTFFEGSLQFFTSAIIPIYALLFLTTELQFGGFLSYIGILGFIVSFILAWRSDKSQRRIGFIIVLFAIMAASILSVAFVHSLRGWLLAIGAFTLVNVISTPLRLAVSMDVKKVDLGFWKAREFFLNLGRFITLALSLILFYYEIYWPVFLLFGLIALFYPLLIMFKLKEIK